MVLCEASLGSAIGEMLAPVASAAVQALVLTLLGAASIQIKTLVGMLKAKAAAAGHEEANAVMQRALGVVEQAVLNANQTVIDTIKNTKGKGGYATLEDYKNALKDAKAQVVQSILVDLSTQKLEQPMRQILGGPLDLRLTDWTERAVEAAVARLK